MERQPDGPHRVTVIWADPRFWTIYGVFASERIALETAVHYLRVGVWVPEMMQRRPGPATCYAGEADGVGSLILIPPGLVWRVDVLNLVTGVGLAPVYPWSCGIPVAAFPVPATVPAPLRTYGVEVEAFDERLVGRLPSVGAES